MNNRMYKVIDKITIVLMIVGIGIMITAMIE